jgi:hypothetical protein
VRFLPAVVGDRGCRLNAGAHVTRADPDFEVVAT